MDLSQVTYIGKTDFRNSLTQFGIRAKDRFRHMYIIGKSGTGKTTLIENMIVQDIYNGNGVAFIDPHGESANKLLRYIPSSRINDVIYFNPGDSEFPVAFNPMEIDENATAAERSLITDGLMTVFKKIWPDAFSGRMEYILNNAMLALLENPEPSLLGINRMLTDKEYRKKMIANVQDPTVRNAWDELMKWDDKRWSEAIGALVNKIGQFTTNPVVRNIIGQPKSTFSFRQVMDEKKILIMNMSKGLIGDQSAALLGAMLITKIYLAGMSRANMTDEQLLAAPPLYFYVDEFQNFANDSFANILSEARKYKLALIVANQYIAQMEETIRDAVFGNMGTTITFRVGPLDAEFIERVYTPVFNAQDLQNIAFGQIFLTLLIDGLASKPFSALTLLPIEPREEPQRELVVETSRKQFARQRAEVEEKILEWFIQQRNASDAANKKEKPTDKKEVGISGTGSSRNFVATSPTPVSVPKPSLPPTEKQITPTTVTATVAPVQIIEKPRNIVNNTSKQKELTQPQKNIKQATVQTPPKKDEKNKPVLVKHKTNQENIDDKSTFLAGFDQAFSVDNKTIETKNNIPKSDLYTKNTQEKQNNKQEKNQLTLSQKPPVQPIIPQVKKKLDKSAKLETKKSLSEILQKVQQVQSINIEQRKKVNQQRIEELRNLLKKHQEQQKTVSQNNLNLNNKQENNVPISTRDRLDQIFTKSEIFRGGDDLPVQVLSQQPKEVPEDILKSIFQSL